MLRALLALAVLLTTAAVFGRAQTVYVPFSEAEIETGLHNGITPAELARLVDKNGVTFKLTSESERRLRAAGADDALVSAVAKPTNLAGVVPGKLTHQVMPVYPPMAKTARVQGKVVLDATVDESGNVVNARVVSGHPMLQQAALDAVKLWKYTPFRAQGRPVSVTTRVTIEFNLMGG